MQTPEVAPGDKPEPRLAERAGSMRDALRAELQATEQFKSDPRQAETAADRVVRSMEEQAERQEVVAGSAEAAFRLLQTTLSQLNIQLSDDALRRLEDFLRSTRENTPAPANPSSIPSTLPAVTPPGSVPESPTVGNE